MPSLEKNLKMWDQVYSWEEDGEEWSTYWGDSAVQWYGTILPRIHSYLPANKILEIAPGHGRWSRFLKDYCNNLVLVDLSPSCIEYCKDRFVDSENISYYTNDGMSLGFVADNSIDFAFSFDSLVHAEDVVINSYLLELSKKLTPNGVAFLHHSNLGNYPVYLKFVKKLGRFRKMLTNLSLIDDIAGHWRAPTMTAEKFLNYCKNHNLYCIAQEKVNWGNTRRTIDCLSLVTKSQNRIHGETTIVANNSFVKEANHLSKLSAIYSPRL